MKVKRQLIASAIFITCLLAQVILADDSDIINPNWVKPGNRHRVIAQDPNPTAQCICPDVPECPTESVNEHAAVEAENSRLALVFFRKFLVRLFDDRQLVMDENKTFKLRNVQLRITEHQLKRIKEAGTARELDDVVTRVVEQSKDSIYQSMAENLCWDLVAWYGTATSSSIFRYVIVPTIVIILVLIFGKILGISLWVFIPALFFIITYVLTYRDCNNRIELESLTKFMNTDGSNPCANSGRSGWWFTRKYNEAECIQHLMEKHGLKRSFCDPSEVLVEMIAKLHLQYFETFVMRMVSIFKLSTASSGIIETFAICVFILFLLYILMTHAIKYGLFACGRFLSDVVTRPSNRDQAANLENDQQQLIPPRSTAPVNVNIRISRSRRTNSRTEAITNRIEDIAEGGGEPNVAASPTQASVEETPRRKEDGSGDGPAVKNGATEESDSSDEELVVVHGDFAEDTRTDDIIVDRQA